MILPGTYTVSASYLPRVRDVEIPRYQTTDLHFPEIAFVGDKDISTYITVLQVRDESGMVWKFNDPVDDMWGFNLYADAMDRLKGSITYTLFAANPDNRKEHYALYTGVITIKECDDYVFNDMILIEVAI
jgi:hypothetical protein